MTEPLSIIGIDVDGVGEPRNDGTAGSGLYAVPVTLSRTPNAREAELLVYFWDHPSSFTTIHRFGSARVAGTSFILDETTIEEMRDYHAATIKLTAAATNEAYAREVETADRRRDAENAQKAAHDAEVRKVAGEITFD